MKIPSSFRSRSPLTAVIPVRYSTGLDNIFAVALISLLFTAGTYFSENNTLCIDQRKAKLINNS